MRLLFFVALSLVAFSAQVCSGRPQALDEFTEEDWEGLDSITTGSIRDAITTESIQDATTEEATKVTVVDALKDISKSLKQDFIRLGDKIKEKLNALKQAFGEQAQRIKAQLKGLKEQLKDSAQALGQKVKDFFNRGRYASLGDNSIQIFQKLVAIRDRLKEFVKGVKEITVDKWQKMQEIAKQLRKEIKVKVQELLHASGDSQVAFYQASDDFEDEDDEAYVIATLKDISKSLKEKFLILVNHLKQKFAELKRVGGEQAEKVKGQLKVLKENLADAREALKQKVQELFKPSQYASFGEHALDILAKLSKLREKLVTFLKEAARVTGEKLQKLRTLIKEARQEIKERIQELIGSGSEKSALYQVDDSDEDDEAYIVDTLRNISKSLKEKFSTLGKKIVEKVEEIKEAAGQRAAVLKKQLNELKEQLGDAARVLKSKLQEIFRPGQYGAFEDFTSAVKEKLSALRKKLERFVESVKTVAKDKWMKMQETIRELRGEIKQSIQKILHEKTDSEEPTTAVPAPASNLELEY